MACDDVRILGAGWSARGGAGPIGQESLTTGAEPREVEPRAMCASGMVLPQWARAGLVDMTVGCDGVVVIPSEPDGPQSR